MSIWDIIEALPRGKARDILAAAYDLADEVHRGETRLSRSLGLVNGDGEPLYDPYLIHPVHGARTMCFEYQCPDPITLSAILLHDSIETAQKRGGDEAVAQIIGRIRKQFGEEILNLVEGVTRLSQDVRQYGPKGLVKLLEGMKSDIRVALIKIIGDNLDNMRDQEVFPRDKQIEHALEALQIYSIFAEALGIWQAKIALDERGWKCLSPRTYMVHMSQAQRSIKLQEERVSKAKAEIEAVAEEMGVNCKVEVRHRSLAELYDQLKRQAMISGQPLIDVLRDNRQIVREKLSADPFYFSYLTVVTDDRHNLDKLERALRRSSAIGGRIFDFYTEPKSGANYRAVHFRKKIPGATETLLVTAVDKDTDFNNRFGVVHLFHVFHGAEGWYKGEYPFLVYLLQIAKEHGLSEAELQAALPGLAVPVTLQTRAKEEFIMHEGDCVLDFAWTLQLKYPGTEQRPWRIAEQAVGARIGGKGGKTVSLDYIFTRADEGLEVEIIKDKALSPHPRQLSIVKTPAARLAIKQKLQALAEADQIRQGKEAVNEETSKFNLTARDLETATVFCGDQERPLLPQFLAQNTQYVGASILRYQDLVRAIGRGEVLASDFAREFNTYYIQRVKVAKERSDHRYVYFYMQFKKDQAGIVREITKRLERLNLLSAHSDGGPSGKGAVLAFNVNGYSSLQIAQICRIATNAAQEMNDPLVRVVYSVRSRPFGQRGRQPSKEKNDRRGIVRFMYHVERSRGIMARHGIIQLKEEEQLT